MAWYRTGTASFTNGSTNVTGTGTDWTVGASNGDALQAPDGRAYEIAAVVSATQLTLAANYLGASASGQSYAISPTQSFVRDLADQVSTLVLDYGSVKSTVAAGKFPDGTAITPGMRFTSDEDTGFRRTASGTVAIVTNGTDKVVVSPSGVTGITKADVGLGNVDNTSNATERAATATLTNKTINLSNNTLVMTSAQLAAALTDETGTGSAVFSVSPALTGTPTAPTAAAGTNTTQLATTAFVVGQAATTAPVNTGLQVLGTSNRYAREDHAHAALDIALRAPIAPTLDLNFAKGYGEVYNPTTGRMERLSAWSDLITYTGANRMYTDAKGILVAQGSNVPRITFDPVTGAGRGLSVWGARTNKMLWSDDLTNAAWSKGDATATANTHAGWGGTLLCNTITMGTNSTAPAQTLTLTDGVTETISFFYRSESTANTLRIRVSTASSSASAFLNTATRVFGIKNTGFSGGIVESFAGVPGLYRVSIQYTPATGDGGARSVGVAGVIGDNSSTADTGKTVIVCGFSCVAESTASPYIPTTTSAVTAPADTATITGSNFSKWFNASEGTFVVVSNAAENLSGSRHLQARSASGSEFIAVINGVGDPSQRRFDVATTSGNQAQLIYSVASPVGVNNTFVGSYKTDSFAASINGGSVQTDSSGAVPAGINQLGICCDSAGFGQLNGTIARILYFPRALPSNLQALSA